MSISSRRSRIPPLLAIVWLTTLLYYYYFLFNLNWLHEWANCRCIVGVLCCVVLYRKRRAARCVAGNYRVHWLCGTSEQHTVPHLLSVECIFAALLLQLLVFSCWDRERILSSTTTSSAAEDVGHYRDSLLNVKMMMMVVIVVKVLLLLLIISKHLANIVL